MKKRFMLSFLIASLLMVGFVLPVVADDFTVALSTYDVTGSTTDFAAGSYPQVANGLVIDKIEFTNLGATQQTITMYDDATSTSTASACGTYGIVATAGEMITVDWPYYNPLKVRNLAVKKSSASSVVHMNIQYR